MGSITVRNIPDSIIKSLKEIAKYRGTSMEQEARNILAYYVMDKADIITIIENSWDDILKPVKKENLDKWLKKSRSWER